MNQKVCPNQPESLLSCPCPKTECVNHAKCCQCIDNHRRINKPTSCMAELVKKQ